MLHRPLLCVFCTFLGLLPIAMSLSPSSLPPVNRLKSMAAGERPQERMQQLGAGSLSDTELLAMLLRNGTRGHDVLSLASQLIAEAGSLSGLIAWHENDFRKLKGIGRVKSLQLLTVMEVARRILSQQRVATPLLDQPDLVVDYMRAYVHGLHVEKFWILCLNRKNRLKRCVEITSGTAHSSLVHPREVFREAIREGSSALLCVHNHPSGDPAPSAADLRITRQLREAAQTVDIALVDHIILGHPGNDPLGIGYYSFRLNGLL